VYYDANEVNVDRPLLFSYIPKYVCCVLAKVNLIKSCSFMSTFTYCPFSSIGRALICNPGAVVPFLRQDEISDFSMTLDLNIESGGIIGLSLLFQKSCGISSDVN
jgi:hypothetical protein